MRNCSLALMKYVGLLPCSSKNKKTNTDIHRLVELKNGPSSVQGFVSDIHRI